MLYHRRVPCAEFRPLILQCGVVYAAGNLRFCVGHFSWGYLSLTYGTNRALTFTLSAPRAAAKLVAPDTTARRLELADDLRHETPPVQSICHNERYPPSVLHSASG